MDKIRLGDIATLINGDRGKNYPSQADIADEGDIPFVNAGHLNGRSIEFKEMNYISRDKFNRLSSGKFFKGDVLYCLRGSLGKKAIVKDDVEGAIASSLVIIRPDYNRIDGDYLMFSLDSPSIKEQLIKANNGSSQPNLSAASVREYQIELPDLKAQKDVVNKLAKVRTIIDSRQHEIDLLDDLIKARFVEMFFDKGYPVLGWNDVFNTTTGKLDSNAMVEDGEYPFFTCAKEVFRIDKYAFDQEALLLAGNNAAGKYDVKYYKGKFNAYQRTYVLGLKQNWSYRLFQYQLEDKLVYLQQQSLGGLTKYLTMKILGNLSFIIPPMDKQIEFEQFVRQVDKSKVAVQKSLDETQKLFDSLMQEYFG